MKSSKNYVVYLLPHNDDEVFAIPKIMVDFEKGLIPIFIYLTHSSDRVRTFKRQQESKKFLIYMKVFKKSNVLYLGEQLSIIDGEVHLHLEALHHKLFSFIKSNGAVKEVVTTAYEGGHQDHDAAAIIGKTLAFKLSLEMSEFFLYNGYKTKGKSYRVSHPLEGGEIETYKYSFKHLIALFIAPIIFKSQWKAMLGLWPFLFFKALIRPLKIKVSVGKNIDFNGHLEVPMYERWKRITLKEFEEKSSHLIPDNINNRMES